MSSLSGLGGPALNFSGLATGIDTERIINGMTALNERRVSVLRARQTEETTKQAVFGGLTAKLVEFQSQAGRLARSIAGAFDVRSATSSDETILTGAASSTATPGTYSLKVEQMAQAHQVASTSLAATSTNIKTGTVQIKVGAGTEATVTIDSTNNTLQGLADAINAQSTDAKASIVSDGTGFRLMMTASKTGQTNAISITNNLTGGDGESIDLGASLVQSATDARVLIGTGPGAVTVTSSTNKVDGAIAGVTLDLKRADTTKTVTFSVANDTTSARKALDDFVKSYNAVMEYVDARDDFDPATRRAGTFLGDRDVADLKNALAAAVTGAVSDVNPQMNRLSALGITLNEKGRMQVDSGKMDRALNGEIQGVTMNDVRRLFGLTGSSTNAGVSFLLGGDKTKPTTTGAPYQVNITQTAARASITGGSVLSGSVVISASNNTFTIKVNNFSSAVVTIDSGSYTSAQLAAAIQAQINGRYGSSQVAVDLDAGRLRMSTVGMGSTSQVLLESGGNALATLGFSGGESGVGRDVAGSFTVNGNTESALGSGQLLSGNFDNAHTAGLQVRVGLTDGQLNAGGPEADITVTQGVASRLNAVVSKFSDPINGRMKSIDDRLKRNAESFEKTITRESAVLEAKKESLLKRFAAMESNVNRLRGLGNQIASSFGVASFGR